MPNEPSITQKAVDLTEISIEVIVKELKRRAVAKGMTTEELLTQAQSNWEAAESEAEDLKNRQ
jgi:hypothetical protein